MNAQTTKTVGASGADYPTLKSAFDAINSGATISGSTSFNNVEITSGKGLLMESGSTMKIAGTIINGGTWYTINGWPTTVEYNGGDQNVLNPNGSKSGYYNLIISGSGTKTFPATSFSIDGDFTVNNSNGITLNSDITIGKTLEFTTGVIHTGSNNVIFSNTSNAVIGASSQKYIDGFCQKIGNTAFTFPVGNNGQYAPISISDANGGGNSTDYFTASYNNTMPHADGLDTTHHDESIVRISKMEYWNLSRSGTNEVSVTLSWGARSGGVSSLSDLTVAHWNSVTSSWEDKGNVTTTGDTSTGTITSGLLSSFSPFTLASKSKNANLLPISLISFDAMCEENHPLLAWVTATEVNNDYFEIQNSTNAINWTTVTRVKGAGNSNEIIQYRYLDNSVNSSSSLLYRLKQVDFDGKFEYLNIIVSKNCDNYNSQLMMYPNPTKGIFNLTYKGDFNEIKSIVIFNVLGEKVYSSDSFQPIIDLFELQNGTYTVQLNLISNSIIEKIVIRK